MNLLAASCPEGQFVGVDLHAQHVALGRERAARAGLGRAGSGQPLSEGALRKTKRRCQSSCVNSPNTRTASSSMIC
ncbi:MAG: class I SAM-dependent methyltransferase [Gammaproteobacteria bacterium]